MHPARPIGPVDSAVYLDFPDPQQIAGVLSLRRSQQQSACHVQIGQATSHEYAVGVPAQPSVAHLAQAKDAIEHQERMFNFCPHFPT